MYVTLNYWGVYIGGMGFQGLVFVMTLATAITSSLTEPWIWFGVWFPLVGGMYFLYYFFMLDFHDWYEQAIYTQLWNEKYATVAAEATPAPVEAEPVAAPEETTTEEPAPVEDEAAAAPAEEEATTI